MTFDIECESKTGQNPKRYTTANHNQDAFYAKDNGKWCCLCMADGAGSKKHSALGAKWLTHDVCEFLIGQADSIIRNDESQIRSQVMECIRQSLDTTAKLRNVDCSELSSTLLCVLTNGEECLVLHMGDGVILAIRNGYLNVLSFPMNGSSRYSTALTTMTNAQQYLRVQKLSCDTISKIWLMTDGAMYEVFQDNYYLKGGSLSMPMIRKILSDGNEDDATYGYIQWRKC